MADRPRCQSAREINTAWPSLPSNILRRRYGSTWAGSRITRLYPATKYTFRSVGRRESASWKYSSGSPGHHHEGHLIIYRDINLYFTHICTVGEKKGGEQGKGRRGKERARGKAAGAGEGRRPSEHTAYTASRFSVRRPSLSLLSSRPFSFATYFPLHLRKRQPRTCTRAVPSRLSFRDSSEAFLSLGHRRDSPPPPPPPRRVPPISLPSRAGEARPREQRSRGLRNFDTREDARDIRGHGPRGGGTSGPPRPGGQ